MKKLPEVINAWGTPTPYGVSRSSKGIAQAAATGLQRHVLMSALQAAVAEEVCALSGTEAACFCHCAAAGITLAVAGALTGTRQDWVQALPHPDITGVVAIQQEHCVDYGHSILQAIRLAGAQVALLTGSASERESQLSDLHQQGHLKAMIWVDSLLVKTEPALSPPAFQALARQLNAVLVMDAAAQDWRLNDKVALAVPDVSIFSAQKYLAAPTCGILVGKRTSIEAAAAHLSGIGRGMKPTKEALFGLSAALSERDWEGLGRLTRQNNQRADEFAARFSSATGYPSEVGTGPRYGPYPRVQLNYGNPSLARQLVETLLSGSEPIAVGKGLTDQGILTIELTHVSAEEEMRLLERLTHLAAKAASER